MTAFAVVVTVDPEGQLPDQLLRAFQDLCIVIEVQFVFEGGEKALHHRVIPATAGRSWPDIGRPDRCGSGVARVRSDGAPKPGSRPPTPTWPPSWRP